MQMMLSEYDIQYVTQKAIEGSVLADYLALQPIEDYQSMQLEFPDEEILVLKDDNNENMWTLFFDEASNALGYGIGAVLIFSRTQYIPMTARLCFDCTNSTTKYEACVIGIRAAIEFGAKW